MLVAVALMQAGQRFATIDLDSRQRTFTHYVENRRAWAQRSGIALELPTHDHVLGSRNKRRSLRLPIDERRRRRAAARAEWAGSLDKPLETYDIIAD